MGLFESETETASDAEHEFIPLKDARRCPLGANREAGEMPARVPPL
jgi:hypothetical protein